MGFIAVKEPSIDPPPPTPPPPPPTPTHTSTCHFSLQLWSDQLLSALSSAPVQDGLAIFIGYGITGLRVMGDWLFSSRLKHVLDAGLHGGSQQALSTTQLWLGFVKSTLPWKHEDTFAVINVNSQIIESGFNSTFNFSRTFQLTIYPGRFIASQYEKHIKWNGK